MKLGEYIKQEVDNGRTDFNIGVWSDMEVDDNSPNRVKFKCRRF